MTRRAPLKTFELRSGDRYYDGVGTNKVEARRAAMKNREEAIAHLEQGSFTPVILPLPDGGLLVVHRTTEGRMQQTFYRPTLTGYEPGSSVHSGRGPKAFDLEERAARMHLSQLWMDVGAGYDGSNALWVADVEARRNAAAYLRWQQSYARLIAAGHPPEYAHRNASASDQEDREAAE